MPATITLPRWECYANYQSSNYGLNALCFTDERGFDFYFSYRTLVAVRVPGHTIIRENVWGPTTGKHLNAIDGGSATAKRARLTKADFERKLAELI